MSLFSSVARFLALPLAATNYRKNLRRTLVALGVDGLLAMLVLIGAMLLTVLPSLPSFDVVTDYRPKIPLRIYTADGAL
ncbi:MAG: penicillin-binding protein, partial [Dechloromonas sp.]|nr:penicillin-binding protein [Dechloromonas sp.]